MYSAELAPPSHRLRAGAYVHAFALSSEDAEDLDGMASGVAERVGHPSVELGSFAGSEHEIMLAEDEAEPSGEDIEPLVAFVDPLLGSGASDVGRDDLFVGLECAEVAGQRDERHAVTREGLLVHAGIAGDGRADELVEGDLMGLSKGKQLPEGWSALSGLES